MMPTVVISKRGCDWRGLLRCWHGLGCRGPSRGMGACLLEIFTGIRSCHARRRSRGGFPQLPALAATASSRKILEFWCARHESTCDSTGADSACHAITQRGEGKHCSIDELHGVLGMESSARMRQARGHTPEGRVWKHTLRKLASHNLEGQYTEAASLVHRGSFLRKGSVLLQLPRGR